MKRTISMVVVLALALMMTSVALADGLSTVDPVEGERPTLSIGFDQLSESSREDYMKSNIFSYVEDKLNINLEYVSFSNAEQLQIALAGGDLPDIIEVKNDYIDQLLSAGMIIPLDDYLDQMPNMVNLSSLRIASTREYFSNGDGKLYFVKPQVGVETPDAYLWNGYTVRWDWYKELGAPEIKTEDDYIAYLKAAVEAHPETANGQKVWGYATYNDLWGWWVPGSFYGFHNITDEYHLRSKDSALVNAYLDPEGPIWKQVHFCYKLNQEGLFDPDSFTMTGDDLRAKVENEQYAAIICQWYDSLYSLKRQEDPDTLAGYVVLPAEGQGNWSGSNFKAGWSFYYGITSNCKNPEVAVKFLDWLNTEDAARLILTGVQGVVWDYDENGTPVITEEALKNKNTMSTDEWNVWGGGLWGGLVGIGTNTVLSDGGKANLWNDREMMIASLRPLDKDFCEFYGVEIPYEAEYQKIEAGLSWDKSETMADIGNLLGSTPTEISRIDNNCREIVYRALPDLVLAANQEEYDAVYAQVQADLKDAGIDESMAWWTSAVEPIKEFIAANQD